MFRSCGEGGDKRMGGCCYLGGIGCVRGGNGGVYVLDGCGVSCEIMRMMKGNEFGRVRVLKDGCGSCIYG